jgi:hypothetical protein
MPELLNAKEYIRKLVNIAYINVGIPLLFFIWVYLESSSEQLIPLVGPEYNLIVFIPVLLICLAIIILGFRKFKLQLLLCAATERLADKLIMYQKGVTIRYVGYSISSLLIAIGFYLTDYHPFEVLFGIMIVLFSIHNPNARRVANDLKLKKEDRIIMLEGHDIPK